MHGDDVRWMSSDDEHEEVDVEGEQTRIDHVDDLTCVQQLSGAVVLVRRPSRCKLCALKRRVTRSVVVATMQRTVV